MQSPGFEFVPSRGGMMCAAFVAAALSFFVAPSLVAQPASIPFERLTDQDGLSQATVLAIAQDAAGFMWFGTQEGLNRYDGKEFRVFHHDPNDPSSLSNNTARALLVDREGVLWVGTEGGGLNRFDASSETFTRFVSGPEEGSLSHDRVRALLEDSAGRLWVGTDGGGLSWLDPETGRFSTLRNAPDLPDAPGALANDRVFALVEDLDGALWVGMNGGGLSRRDPGADHFVHYRHDPQDPSSLSDDHVRSLYVASDGQLWIGTYEGGLNRFDPETGSFQRYQHDPGDPTSLSANRVRGLYEDQSGILWVATDGGLCAWQADSKSFLRYRHDPTLDSSLIDDRVVAVLQDRGGVLWVGTYGGLGKWNALTGSFELVRYLPEAGLLSNPVVLAFAEDRDGAMWIGTYGGLDWVDPQSGEHRRFQSDPNDPSTLSDDRVGSLLVDSQERLWVGTVAGGLNLLDRQSGEFESFRHSPDDPKSLSADSVTSIQEDRRGNLWIGTYGGGLNLRREGGQGFERFGAETGRRRTTSNRIATLYEDQSGALWIGTDGGGLNRLDPATGRIQSYRHDASDPESLGSDHVWAVHEDLRGNLWVGTQGVGLNLWRHEDRVARRARFSRIGKADGLTSTAIYGILSDVSGHVWVSSNHGLSRFDPGSRSFRHYDVSAGLQSNEFNSGAAFQSSRGRMYFGGPQGFNSFHPSDLGSNQFLPPVVITPLADVDPKSAAANAADSTEIRRTHKQPIISFDFVALDFTSPKKNRYKHRLEGFESEWVESDGSRGATYTNLDPGRYVFRVIASNNDGVWNEVGASRTLIVVPPPWRSGWAFGLYGLTVLAAMIGMVRFQFQQRARALELSAANRSLERQIEAHDRARGEIRKLSLAVEQSPASVMITDPDGRIEYVNPKFEELTGFEREEVVGRHPDFLDSGYTASNRHTDLWQKVRSGVPWRGELHNRKKSGDLFWEFASISPLKSEDGSVSHILAVNEDITVRKEYEERLVHQAHFDQLTQLPNRVLALDRLSRVVVQSQRSGRPLGVMFVDLDNFKIVNDTLGHETGDRLLVAAAERLSETLRMSDTVARLGGDEFLVVLADLDNVVDAEVAASKILSAFAQPFNLDGRDVFVTASVGVTVSPEDGEDPQALLRNADAAMYRAKEQGRNCYQFFTPSMNERAVARLTLESHLRKAIELDQLEVGYQPLIDLAKRKVIGAEALLSWNSAELGAVSPEDFIPVAEETGLIVELGSAVLRKACHEAREWREQTGEWLRVAVNVSARQFKGRGLLEDVKVALEKSGLPPECLELEITERLLVEDARETALLLDDIVALGVRLSLDDFGTGYSALSYLKKFPLHALKIDRSFVNNVLENSEDRSLVAAIVAMGRSLGLEVVAEGVETPAQLRILQSKGCRVVQGFLFGRAMSSDFLVKLIEAEDEPLARLLDEAPTTRFDELRAAG